VRYAAVNPEKEDIEDLINSQKSAIKIYAFFAFGIVLFGIFFLIFANFFIEKTNTDVIKTIINIGGGFITVLSGFPIKEIINRKDKIATFQILKRHVSNITDNKTNLTEQEKNEIVALVMEIIKKNSLGT
jgi:hypothetical protein